VPGRAAKARPWPRWWCRETGVSSWMRASSE
jgi:hypothetical protein